VKSNYVIRNTQGDKVFEIANYILITLGTLIVLYPLYFVIIASISDPNLIYEGKVILIPKNISFEGYKRLIEDKQIWMGYLNTIKYTITGTAINVFLTLTAAFTLSRKGLIMGKFFMYLIVLTMFFNGGLIPNYILVQKLGWIDKMWALIIPVAVGPWNLIIARTFFQSNLPEEICEAASIDGSSHFSLFVQIVLPTSKVLIVILILFYSLNHWNSYLPSLLYIRSAEKYPLQLVLRNILIESEMAASLLAEEDMVSEKLKMADLIKYASIIVAILPIVSLYTFVQKYFVQGVMIGAIKG